MGIGNMVWRGQLVLLGQLGDLVSILDVAFVWLIPVALLCAAILLYFDLSRRRDE